MTDRRGGRPRAVRWGMVIAWGAVILLLSSVPDAGERLPGALRFAGSDLLAHALVYGVLGALLANAMHAVWPSVALASAFGALDELYQGLVPGRFPSVGDWAADTLGAAVGAAVVVHLARRRRDAR